MPSKQQAPTPDWRSEQSTVCTFCGSARVPDPDNVIVAPCQGNGTQAICETCLRGATCAASREYRRISQRQKKPPQGPKGTPKKTA